MVYFIPGIFISLAIFSYSGFELNNHTVGQWNLLEAFGVAKPYMVCYLSGTFQIDNILKQNRFLSKAVIVCFFSEPHKPCVKFFSFANLFCQAFSHELSDL